MTEEMKASNPIMDDSAEVETVRIRKVHANCSLCEDYAARNAAKPVAILSCEGACLRGEISRRAANQITFRLAPDETVRICLGGAFTKDTGQRNLVRSAGCVVVIEGCFIRCASRMMQGVLPDLKLDVVIADSLYELDGDYFGIDEVADAEIQAHAETVATRILEKIRS